MKNPIQPSAARTLPSVAARLKKRRYGRRSFFAFSSQTYSLIFILLSGLACHAVVEWIDWDVDGLEMLNLLRLGLKDLGFRVKRLIGVDWPVQVAQQFNSKLSLATFNIVAPFTISFVAVMIIQSITKPLLRHLVLKEDQTVQPPHLAAVVWKLPGLLLFPWFLFAFYFTFYFYKLHDRQLAEFFPAVVLYLTSLQWPILAVAFCRWVLFPLLSRQFQQTSSPLLPSSSSESKFRVRFSQEVKLKTFDGAEEFCRLLEQFCFLVLFAPVCPLLPLCFCLSTLLNLRYVLRRSSRCARLTFGETLDVPSTSIFTTNLLYPRTWTKSFDWLSVVGGALLIFLAGRSVQFTLPTLIWIEHSVLFVKVLLLQMRPNMDPKVADEIDANIRISHYLRDYQSSAQLFSKEQDIFSQCRWVQNSAQQSAVSRWIFGSLCEDFLQKDSASDDLWEISSATSETMTTDESHRLRSPTFGPLVEKDPFFSSCHLDSLALDRATEAFLDSGLASGLSLHSAAQNFESLYRAAKPNLQFVNRFLGVWRCNKTKSDELEPISKHMGVPYIVRRAIEQFTPSNQYAWESPTSIKITTFLPMGHTKNVTLNLLGQKKKQDDQDVGAWSSTTSVEEETIVTVNVKEDEEGLRMVETRQIIPAWLTNGHPNVKEDVLWYQVVLHKSDLDAPVTVNRYFDRTEGPPDGVKIPRRRISVAAKDNSQVPVLLSLDDLPAAKTTSPEMPTVTVESDVLGALPRHSPTAFEEKGQLDREKNISSPLTVPTTIPHDEEEEVVELSSSAAFSEERKEEEAEDSPETRRVLRECNTMAKSAVDRMVRLSAEDPENASSGWRSSQNSGGVKIYRKDVAGEPMLGRAEILVSEKVPIEKIVSFLWDEETEKAVDPGLESTGCWRHFPLETQVVYQSYSGRFGFGARDFIFALRKTEIDENHIVIAGTSLPSLSDVVDTTGVDWVEGGSVKPNPKCVRGTVGLAGYDIQRVSGAKTKVTFFNQVDLNSAAVPEWIINRVKLDNLNIVKNIKKLVEKKYC